MKRCVLCACDSTMELHGFGVCAYHESNSEDAPPCPRCSDRPRGMRGICPDCGSLDRTTCSCVERSR